MSFELFDGNEVTPHNSIFNLFRRRKPVSLNLPAMVPARRGDGEPSTNLKEYGYEPGGRGLIVRFTNDKLAFYPTVTPEGYNALAGAWSPGSHFSKHIKKNHQHTYLDEEKPAQQKPAAVLASPGDDAFTRAWREAQARTEMEEDIKDQTPRNAFSKAWRDETGEDLDA